MRSSTVPIAQLVIVGVRFAGTVRRKSTARCGARDVRSATALAMAAEPGLSAVAAHGENSQRILVVSVPLLVLYYGGNSFFTMAPLARPSRRKYPQYKGRVCAEPCRPAHARQTEWPTAARDHGRQRGFGPPVKPDAYFGSLNARFKGLIDSKALTSPAVPYDERPGDHGGGWQPKRITGSLIWRPGVRLACPTQRSKA
jgi:hypothetical protein